MVFHTTLQSHQRRRESEDEQEAAHDHHHHLQVDQSHPTEEVQDVNITRTRNIDAIIPLPVHQIRLLQAVFHHRLLSILHLSQRFQIITEEEKFHYSVPGDMAIYVNKNFNRFLSEKDLKENILKENLLQRQRAAQQSGVKGLLILVNKKSQ